MPSGYRFPVRVYYEDTDFSGVVYHANYLRFLERGRTEFLRSVGLDGRTMFEGRASGQSIAFIVFAMTIAWRAPARMDDLLAVETRVQEVRGASARMGQSILRDGATLVTADVRIATVAAGRPVRFPRDIRDALTRNVVAD